MTDRILIVDFGSQVTQLIARRVRETGVYCEIHPFNKVTEDSIRAFDPKGVILSGGPASVTGTDTPRGVGVHPHRGFETVTIAYKGCVEHGDSAGGGGIIGEGDVQWMTAASGVLHKEFHETEWAKEGGIFQMVQLWVNLPAKDKMSAPKYQAIKNSEMKLVDLGEYGFIEVIAGEFESVKNFVLLSCNLSLLT